MSDNNPDRHRVMGSHVHLAHQFALDCWAKVDGGEADDRDEDLSAIADEIYADFAVSAEEAKNIARDACTDYIAIMLAQPNSIVNNFDGGPSNEEPTP